MKPVKKYKISRRLEMPVFEKCQTHTYAMRERQRAPKRRKRASSEYGRQMLEKQKVRYLYNVGEKWLKRCVRESHALHGPLRESFLVSKLERRLDNIVYRMGLVDTRRMARQVVSHGHITVNGKRITVPSYTVRDADVIGIRTGSLRTALFTDLKEKMNARPGVSWVEWKEGKNEGRISGAPAIDADLLELASVFEYYSR